MRGQDCLPLPGVKGRPQPLSEIAAERGVPVSEVIATVEAAVAELRAERDAAHDGKDDRRGESP